MDDYNYDELSRSLMKNEIAKIVIVNNDIIEIEFIQENSTTKKDNKKMLYSKNLFEVVYSNYLNKKTNNEGNVIITREKRPKVDELLKELVSIGLLIMIGYFVLIFIYSEMPISKDKKISKFLVNEKKNDVSISDIGGLFEVREEILEYINMLKYPNKIYVFGCKSPKRHFNGGSSRYRENNDSKGNCV
jgi:ATP-dependent Zn protease